MSEPTSRPKFELVQARELAEAFAREGVDYLFLGKAGAILLGYPGTTLDLDLFAPKDPENAKRCIRALTAIGFAINEATEEALLAGKDFVQIKDGPFDVDIIHAPDGIESFEAAKRRRVVEDIFPVASLQDIIASKKASNRRKDLVDMGMLEEFAVEFIASKTKMLPSALEAATKRFDSNQ
jgi:hypothetical protein